MVQYTILSVNKMAVESNQCNDAVLVHPSSVESTNGPKKKSLDLSASDYSAIFIDSPTSKIKTQTQVPSEPGFGCFIEPTCASVTQKSKYHVREKDANFIKATLRRRHSSIQQRTSFVGTDEPLSSDASLTPCGSSHQKKPPIGLRRNNSDRASYAHQSLKRNQTKNQTNNSSVTLTPDDVSVVSTIEDLNDNHLVDFNCPEKFEKEASAIKQLKKISSHIVDKSNCYHDHNPILHFNRWCDKPNNEPKSTSSSGKKRTPPIPSNRSSPAVFSRLLRDVKDKTFAFFHCRDYTDYMYNYRIHHTVANVGDLAKQPPVLGRDVPDPYITKPSNICLMTDMKSVSSAISGFSASRKLDENHRGSCPNLSPSKPTEDCGERKKPETDMLTPSQHIISLNDYLEAYLPQSFTLPRITSRSDSSPALLGGDDTELKISAKNCEGVSTQFDGEIVGVKHKLPVATAYNFSALCKPTAGEDLYGDLKSGASSSRGLSSTRKRPKADLNANDACKKDTVPNNCSPKCGSHKASHSEKGCHGCSRITSLIRSHRKTNKKDESKSTSSSSCKPLDEQSLNVFHRLQKLPIG